MNWPSRRSSTASFRVSRTRCTSPPQPPWSGCSASPCPSGDPCRPPRWCPGSGRPSPHTQLVPWFIASLALWVVYTLTALVPINNRIAAWTEASRPADWKISRSRWDLLHRWRVLLLAVAFIRWQPVSASRDAGCPIPRSNDTAFSFSDIILRGCAASAARTSPALCISTSVSSGDAAADHLSEEHHVD